jgi:hypothetical protein
MESQGVPEAWIGQEVVLHTVSDREFLTTYLALIRITQRRVWHLRA